MEDDLTVIGDPEKLARVFNNLLRNAASYCYANTEISISAKKERQLRCCDFSKLRANHLRGSVKHNL